MKQTTLQAPISVKGIGVHGGNPSHLILHPAEAGSGYTFLRTNLPDGAPVLIDARHSSVSETAFRTVVRGERDASISTVEHVLAALAGLGVDNALIEVDGEEMPIMDGSAREFVAAIRQVGLRTLSQPRKIVKVLRKVSVAIGRAAAELAPVESGFHLDVEIDFSNPAIGRQRRLLELGATAFERDIAPARTFGFYHEAEALLSAGFARGASLDNTIVLNDNGIMNPGGLRFGDEFVRHKILDAIGDLALAGAVLQASYTSFCPGHRLNFMMLDALFSDRANYAIVEAGEARSAQLRPEMVNAAHAPDRS